MYSMNELNNVIFLDTKVSAGFPSPADDFVSFDLNLHDYLVNNPMSTFCIRVTGDSMINIGIFSGDILIIDRSINPINNHIILAVLDGEFLLKRLNFQKGNVVLKAENEHYQPILVNKNTDFIIWGVVTASIKKFL